MQSLQNSHRRRNLLLTIAVAVIIVAGLAFFAYATKIWPFDQTNSGSSSSELNDNSSDKTNTDTTPTTSENPTDATSNSVKNQNTSPNTDQSTSGDVLTITSVNTSGSNVSVRTLIRKVTTEGTCNLSVTNESNGKTYTNSAAVQALSSSSTCEGFSVPISSLGTGDWRIKIDYVLNGTVAGSDSMTEKINA